MNIILLSLTFTVIILTVRLIGNRTHFHTILEQLYTNIQNCTRLRLVQLRNYY